MTITKGFRAPARPPSALRTPLFARHSRQTTTQKSVFSESGDQSHWRRRPSHPPSYSRCRIRCTGTQVELESRVPRRFINHLKSSAVNTKLPRVNLGVKLHAPTAPTCTVPRGPLFTVQTLCTIHICTRRCGADASKHDRRPARHVRFQSDHL